MGASCTITRRPVFINGRRVPVTGRISMDLCSIDLGASATDQVGDAVILWGEDLPVEEIAERAGTIPYQLVCGITPLDETVGPLSETGSGSSD